MQVSLANELAADDIPVGDNADREHRRDHVIHDHQFPYTALLHFPRRFRQRFIAPCQVYLSAAYVPEVHALSCFTEPAYSGRAGPDIRIATHCRTRHAMAKSHRLIRK
jgi:hypothetical protein